MALIYSEVSKNNRKTWILMTLVFAVLISFGWFLSWFYNSKAILIVAVIFSIFLNVLSYWHSDKIVLALAGAKPIEKKDNPELFRLIENLTIAAGLPMPKIYVTPDLAPNAFATGRDKNHSAIAITKGLLKIMDKEELEGVLAHELSHIGNKDTLISTVVVVIVGLISLLADFFLRLSFWGGGRRSDDRESSSQLTFLIGILGAILAPLAASLIQLAISRRRESLADASAALLTRYPEGLARALEKIAKTPYSINRPLSATAHLWISNPFKADRISAEKKTPFLVKIFMTHPPIEERIKALREMSI